MPTNLVRDKAQNQKAKSTKITKSLNYQNLTNKLTGSQRKWESKSKC
jgi:hypothetical protein